MSGQRASTVGLLVLGCCVGLSPAQNRRPAEPGGRGIADLAREAQRQTEAAEAARKQYVWQAQCLARDPYRKVGNVFLDLRTMTAAVLANHPSNRPPEVRRWGFFTNGDVRQVLGDGLRIQVAEESVLVVNHPAQRIAHDRMTLEPFAACEVGRYLVPNASRAPLTLRQFDYGIPFDPWQRKRELDAARDAATNSPPTRRAESGSGFFITYDGYFVTSERLVAEAERVEIKTAQGTFPAHLVVSSKEDDLAILKAIGTFAALAIRTNSPRLGEAVFAVGYPAADAMDLTPAHTDGKVSHLAGLQGEPDRFQVGFTLLSGHTGGPLADLAGEVVGVVVARPANLSEPSSSTTLPPRVAEVVTASRLAALARVVPELRGKLRTPGNDRASDPPEAVKRVADASGMVFAY